MEYTTSLEQLQGQEELGGVGPHRLDVEAHVFAVALQNLTQVHAVKECRKEQMEMVSSNDLKVSAVDAQ